MHTNLCIGTIVHVPVPILHLYLLSKCGHRTWYGSWKTQATAEDVLMLRGTCSDNTRWETSSSKADKAAKRDDEGCWKNRIRPVNGRAVLFFWKRNAANSSSYRSKVNCCWLTLQRNSTRVRKWFCALFLEYQNAPQNCLNVAVKVARGPFDAVQGWKWPCRCYISA